MSSTGEIEKWANFDNQKKFFETVYYSTFIEEKTYKIGKGGFWKYTMKVQWGIRQD